MLTQRAKLFASSAVLAVGLALASGAQAALVVSGSVGGSPTGTIFENFDSLALGNAAQTSSQGIDVSFVPDGQTVQGAVVNTYAAPVLSNNQGANFGPQADGVDTTHYISSGTGQAILDFSNLGPQTYLGLLWGSVDTYNTLDFYDGITLVGSVISTDFTAGANGDQTANGTFYVNITSDVNFDRVVARSSQYAFEFDNVSFNNDGGPNGGEVPEPASLALLGLGLAGLGIMTRRRKID